MKNDTRFIGSRSPARTQGPRPQAGFTLIELMISLTIGLFIVLALLTLLINVNRNNGELTKTNRMIENGRFALQLLQSDVSQAGYWAGYLPPYDDLSNTTAPNPWDLPDTVPDPCVAYSAGWTATGTFSITGNPASYLTDLLGTAVQTYEIPKPVPSPT
ncbi:MAG TPA: prepilin-type N-terminal cleavage/methylation domain-containing protein, partial [Ramlibacter sp.]|nr:prepilin-type N-terminal cleavage/methylation domain-containing protein [Ramlibacter sp.]